MEILIGLVKIMIGFTLIIGIHELGHAIAAILCGVKVKRFSIGMGPGIIIKKVPKFNELALSPIVIGGYVALDDEALAQKSFLKKFFVSISGMLANVILAIILLVLLGGNFFKVVFFSFYIWLWGWPLSISLLLQKAVPLQEAVAGPIGIGQIMVENAMPYLLVLAVLNLAIAMFNLLPLPPLDGGRIFIDFWALIFGKEKAEKLNKVLAVIGVILLLSLLILATMSDLSKLFK